MRRAGGGGGAAGARRAGAHFVAADLADAAATAASSRRPKPRSALVDALVNAAGLTDRGTILDTPVELWDRLFAVNARAPFS
jgi:NAD(P)-dependent dehydrogenase (short-subunit alcohol dehydrogenase family)